MNVNVPIEELERLLRETEHDMPRAVATVVSGLELTRDEVDRIADPSLRAKADRFGGDDAAAELDRLLQLDNLLSTLKLRARRVLAEHPAPAEAAA